jgi:AAA domain-containing protein
MEKVRVLFLLERPFPVAEHGAAGIEAWRVKYTDVCWWLGIPFDKACTDPNRLMFLPRRPKDGAAEGWRTLMIPGKALDLDLVPRSITAQAARDRSHRAPGSSEAGFKTPGMNDFLRGPARTFEAADWVKAKAPNDVLHDYGDQEDKGIDARCPFKDGHTNQDSKDRAFAVRNASKNRGHGFWMNCLTEGCGIETNGDRGAYLDALCQEYGVKHADELLAWCPRHEVKSGGAAEGSGVLYQATCFADVEEKATEWLWKDRIPLGKLGLIAGPPKRGKSQLLCKIIAAVTTGGELPDGARAAMGSVIFIGCEDDVASTIRPRLEVAGADISKVHGYDWTVVPKDKGSIELLHFDVQNHAPRLEALIKKLGDVRLIGMDPITAYMGKSDSHKAAEVRAALAPIQRLAEKYGATVALISHPQQEHRSQNGAGASSGLRRLCGCRSLAISHRL